MPEYRKNIYIITCLNVCRVIAIPCIKDFDILLGDGGIENKSLASIDFYNFY